MLNPLSVMVRPIETFDLCKFGQFYINNHITNDKLHNFKQSDQRKKSKIHQNSDNPKNGQTLEQG